MLTVGLAGGATLTAVAGARRASTAVDRFVDRTHPAHGTVLGDPSLYPRIARLPQVAAATQAARMLMARLDPQGQPDRSFSLGEVAVDDPGFSLPIVVSGRRARPDSVFEVTINPSAAKNGHLEVGSSVQLQAFVPEESEALLRGSFAVPTGPIVTVKVVGIERYPADLNVAESAPGVTYASADTMFFTPAFLHAYVDHVAVAGGIYQLFRLKAGPAGLSSFQGEVARLSEGQAAVLVGSDDEVAAAKANRATRLEALALLLFAVLAAIVTMTMIAQAFARQVHFDALEYPIQRALGMTRRQLVMVAAGRGALIGAAGAAVAAAVLVALSPRMPIGLARQAEARLGYSPDLLVMGVGTLAVVALLTGWAALVAWPAAAMTRSRPWSLRAAGLRSSLLVEALSRSGLSPSATIGARLALEPGRGSTAVQVRTMLATAAVAVGVVAGTVVFGANLARLAMQPRLQGWNWDVAVGNPHSDDVAGTAIPMLAANPAVSGFSSIAGAEAGSPSQVDGHGVALFGMDAVQGSVLPPYTVGRPPERSDEIAFGARTLEALHRKVGDRVTVSTGGPPRTLVITGRLVLTPTVVNDSVSFGQGGVLTTAGLHALGTDAPVTVFLVRLAPGTDRAAAMQQLRADFPGTVLTPVRPADVENLRRVDALPRLLASLFGLVAMLTVGNALVTSVRRRRRDFAILRSMGFVQRQVVAAIAWQATIVAVVGLVVGLPLGLAFGRWGWTLITDRLGLPSDPVVPGLMLLVIALLTLAAVNLVAIMPALLAVRTSPATVLHVE